MVGESQVSEIGFGISTTCAADAEYTIHILPDNRIKVTGDIKWTGTFKKFITEFNP